MFFYVLFHNQENVFAFTCFVFSCPFNLTDICVIIKQ